MVRETPDRRRERAIPVAPCCGSATSSGIRATASPLPIELMIVRRLMSVIGLRLAVGAAASLAMAASCQLGLAAGTAAAPTPAVTLSVHIGYHDTVKAGDWMPVTVDITNAGADLDGTLEVQAAASNINIGGPPSGAAVYRTPVSLAAGAAKQVRTYTLVDQPGAITAQLVREGRVIASKQATAANTPTLLIGVVSDQPSTLNSLAATNPVGISASVVHLTTDDLSDIGLV